MLVHISDQQECSFKIFAYIAPVLHVLQENLANALK